MVQAVCKRDNTTVVIKAAHLGSRELAIVKHFSKDGLNSDPHNCLPVLDILQDPLDATMFLIVTPAVRPFAGSDLRTVADAVQFVEQTLQVS